MTNTPCEDELATLRARAYGKNPDIHEDPTALKRLAELEGLLDAGEKKADVVSSGEDASGLPADAVDDPLPATVSAERPPIATSTKTRKWWIAAVVGAAIAGLISGFVVANYDPTVIATLHESHDAAIPDDLNGAEFPNPIRFEDYEGIVVVAFSDTGDEGAQSRNCVAVQEPLGMTVGGCSHGGLDALVQIMVTKDSPPAIADLFPEGTTLRFTYTNGVVLVRSSAR